MFIKYLHVLSYLKLINSHLKDKLIMHLGEMVILKNNLLFFIFKK